MRRLLALAALVAAPLLGACLAVSGALTPAADPWDAYRARSAELRAGDSAVVYAELRALGATRMSRAPYLKEAFDEAVPPRPELMRTPRARALGESILSFQTPSGGWSKHVDFAQGPRKPGQSYFSESDSWQYIATFDNSATTSQLRFLAALDSAQPDRRLHDAIGRGLQYIVEAQMPNGCWPQVFPLMGGYHDAATFNDDVTVRAAEVLADVAAGRFRSAAAGDREVAASRLAKAVDCILRAQVAVDGRLTVWGQQHDPLTLAPIAARSYEPASLASKESAAIGRFLLSLPDPDKRVVAAVHAAADWFKATRIEGHSYDGYIYTSNPRGSPLWARLSEIGTNRPIFSNRDGVILYDWNQLTDRRTGYGWFSDAPAAFLTRYERWARAHPRP